MCYGILGFVMRSVVSIVSPNRHLYGSVRPAQQPNFRKKKIQHARVRKKRAESRLGLERKPGCRFVVYERGTMLPSGVT